MRSTPERLWPGAAAYEARRASPEQRERVLVAGHSGDELGGVVEEIAKPHAAPRDSEELTTEHTLRRALEVSVVRSVVRVSEEEVSSEANQNGEKKKGRQWHWQGAETRRIERERESASSVVRRSVVGSEDCASVVRRSVVGSVDCERREVRREECRSAGGVVRSVGVKTTERRSGGCVGCVASLASVEAAAGVMLSKNVRRGVRRRQRGKRRRGRGAGQWQRALVSRRKPNIVKDQSTLL